MVEHVRIAMKDEHWFIMFKKTAEKGIVINKIYGHVYIQITRSLPISSGSINIKGVRIEYLNVGGTLATHSFN